MKKLKSIDLPLEVDTGGWTLGEIEDIEDVTGKPVGALNGQTPQTMSIKQIIALAFVSARRLDPQITLDDIRALNPDEDLDFGGDDEEDDEEVDLGPLDDDGPAIAPV